MRNHVWVEELLHTIASENAGGAITPIGSCTCVGSVDNYRHWMSRIFDS
jgi:hypothetical protein